MKVAIFCTNEFSVPAPNDIIYAPIFLFKELTDKLQQKGVDVTVFASSDSATKCKHESLGMVSFQKAGYKNMWGNFHDQEVVTLYEQALLSKIIQIQHQFDIIHIYHQIIHFLPFVPLCEKPIIATLHDPISDKREFLFNYYPWQNKINYVSISNAQRKLIPEMNFIQTIYNGVSISKYHYMDVPEDYFIFVGRVSAEKGVAEAIKAVLVANEKLIIVGPIWDQNYFKKEVEPYIDGEKIIMRGRLNRDEIQDLYSKAKGLLFPSVWEEPFGLVMIEAMACGTPVIGFDRGSVKEVVADKQTGFVVDNVKAMGKAMKKINTISRKSCREHVEKKFTIDKMVNDYLDLYQRLKNRI